MDIPSVSVNDKPVEFDDSDAAQQHRADVVRTSLGPKGMDKMVSKLF